MDTAKICQNCGKPLGDKAVEGLCPECFLKVGLGSGTAPESGGPGQPKADGFVPPTPTELARYFPSLEILELLGRGGMGAVYRARQKELERFVALKILPPGIGDDPAFAERFAREAKALAKLNHPGIVTLYEFGRADGLFYFLMEFVDGVNLRQLLQAGRVAPREALAIVPQICDALQYAHDQGIVHRDIKPANILLDRQGRVKVADFGLARLMGIEAATAGAVGGKGPSASVTLTESGKIMGTPPYMAPEQKDRPLEVDHRADIYSLGVVLYQMLTGELPGKPIEPPSKKVHMDVRLDEVVLRALEKKPERRYQQVSEVKSDVETIATTPPGSGRTVGTERERGGREEAQPEKAEASFQKREKGEDLVTPAALETKPRLSPTAIWGAVLAAFPLLALAVYLLAIIFDNVSLPPLTPPLRRWFPLLVLPVSLLGVVGLFGTTILGWIAVSQIRRSAGRLYGLGLAVFDGLLLPLLALDLVIGCGFGTGLALVAQRWLREHGLRESVWYDLSPFASFLLMIATFLVVDFLIIRAVWRAVNRPLGNAMYSRPFASAQPIRGAGVWKVALAVILALAITVGVFLYAMFRPAVPPKHETIDLGGGVKMEFVLIPPGTFTMGSDIGLPSEYVDEKPAHKVTITKPFYLGKFEVTQEQWESVMGNNPSQFKGPKLPVETVSWDDCQDFLAELRKKTGRQFALPTEAQWEYACRAGSTTLYGFGESEVDLADYAWFAGNSEGRTHPVGEKKPNRWGLHDMHGNVSEWCADWYSLYASSVALVDPQGPPSGQLHVIRGGAWPQFPNGLRSSNRAGDRRGYRRGFRCVMSVGETTATRRDPYGDQAPRMLVRQTAASGGDPYRDQALGRASLEGKPLPDLGNVGLALDAAPIGKPLLLCLLDAEQRPSRHVARLLAERHDALNQKGVTVLAVQVAAASTESLREWTNSTPIPFPVGSVAEKTAANKWATSVTSLPWLILRDANGTVTAEGFALDALSTKMEALRK